MSRNDAGGGALDIHDRVLERHRRPPERFEKKFLEYVPAYGAYLPRAPAFRTVSAAEAQQISRRLSRPTVMSSLRHETASERPIRSSSSRRERSNASLKNKSGMPRGAGEGAEYGGSFRQQHAVCKSSSEVDSGHSFSKEADKLERYHKASKDADSVLNNSTDQQSLHLKDTHDIIYQNEDNTNEMQRNNNTEKTSINKSLFDRKDKHINSDDSFNTTNVAHKHEDKDPGEKPTTRMKRLKLREKENKTSLLQQIMNLHAIEMREFDKKQRTEAKRSRHPPPRKLYTKLGYSPYLEPMLQWCFIIAYNPKKNPLQRSSSGKQRRSYSRESNKAKTRTQVNNPGESQGKQTNTSRSKGAVLCTTGNESETCTAESRASESEERSDGRSSTFLSSDSLKTVNAQRRFTFRNNASKVSKLIGDDAKLLKDERPRTALEYISSVGSRGKVTQTGSKSLPSLTHTKRDLIHTTDERPRTKKDHHVLKNENSESECFKREEQKCSHKPGHISLYKDNQHQGNLKQGNKQKGDNSPTKSISVKVRRGRVKQRSRNTSELPDLVQDQKVVKISSKGRKSNVKVAANTYKYDTQDEVDDTDKKWMENKARYILSSSEGQKVADKGRSLSGCSNNSGEDRMGQRHVEKVGKYLSSSLSSEHSDGSSSDNKSSSGSVTQGSFSSNSSSSYSSTARSERQSSLEQDTELQTESSSSRASSFLSDRKNVHENAEQSDLDVPKLNPDVTDKEAVDEHSILSRVTNKSSFTSLRSTTSKEGDQLSQRENLEINQREDVVKESLCQTHSLDKTEEFDKNAQENTQQNYDLQTKRQEDSKKTDEDGNETFHNIKHEDAEKEFRDMPELTHEECIIKEDLTQSCKPSMLLKTSFTNEPQPTGTVNPVSQHSSAKNSSDSSSYESLDEDSQLKVSSESDTSYNLNSENKLLHSRSKREETDTEDDKRSQ